MMFTEFKYLVQNHRTSLIAERTLVFIADTFPLIHNDSQINEFLKKGEGSSRNMYKGTMDKAKAGRIEGGR